MKTTSPTDYARHEHHEFLTASQAALADESLQSSLSLLGSSLGHRNAEAFAAFPASAQLREKARAIKDATLADLDTHVETLEASVKSRGGQVYFAADGADACEIIVGILKKAGVRRVVKSKSMTTEEIHLNPALEAAGIEPIETDFGEYIIQVAGQRPSHIVAPAIHLRATHVAEILSPVAGETLPPDATRLAAFARKRLRDAFATADAGITGANFAVAETGSIVLLENEGNIRLSTGMPRVHVAVVGIEKLIPRMADLPVFLKILARRDGAENVGLHVAHHGRPPT